MNNKLLKVLLVISLLMFIVINSGCFDRRELNNLAIVSAAGIDLGPKEDELTYIYQIINPSSIAGQGFNSLTVPFIVQRTTGKTVFEATSRANIELPRELYYDHMQIFVIGYDYAKEKGINGILDGLYRDHEVRENLYILVAENGRTETILSALTALENFNGIYIKDVLDNAYEHQGATRPVELREVVNTLASGLKSVVIPLVKMSTENKSDDTSNISNAQSTKQESVIKVEGFAVFKEDKIIGTLDYLEALAYNCITDKLKRTICVVEYDNSYHSIELIKSKTEMKAKFKNGQPTIILDVKHQAHLDEVTAGIDISDPKIIEALESETNKKIEMGIEKLIKKCQEEWHIDIFGFAEALKKQDPKEWRKIENDWKDYYSDLKVEIKVNTTIREVGMKNKTFLKKAK